jgi:predicted nucleic acid-binding protein
MNALVVDTNVVSFIFKGHPIAHRYLPDLTGCTPVLSFMTVAELDRWAISAGWGVSRRERLNQYVAEFAIFPYNRELCKVWAEITVAAESVGRRIECADAWIAATAIVCDVPLITHNSSDYLGVPALRLISHEG